jgi:hypothetical protein
MHMRWGGMNDIVRNKAYRGRRLVLITVPSASTTVRFTTQSFIVPYRTALVPEQLVPTIPPIFALGKISFYNNTTLERLSGEK